MIKIVWKKSKSALRGATFLAMMPAATMAQETVTVSGYDGATRKGFACRFSC